MTISQEREENLKYEAFLEQEASNKELQKLSGYNTRKAVAYAQKWAKKRNSDYPKYTSDCTNFVSQCLVAGGAAQKKPAPPSGIYETSSYWYCYLGVGDGVTKPFYLSSSWMRVSNTKSFFDYWSSRVPVSSYTDVATLYNYC